jgi:hypothetical protein
LPLQDENNPQKQCWNMIRGLLMRQFPDVEFGIKDGDGRVQRNPKVGFFYQLSLSIIVLT